MIRITSEGSSAHASWKALRAGAGSALAASSQTTANVSVSSFKAPAPVAVAEARLPHNCRERRLPFLLCRNRRKDAEARAGDDLIVKLAIDAPLDLVRKVLKYV